MNSLANNYIPLGKITLLVGEYFIFIYPILLIAMWIYSHFILKSDSLKFTSLFLFSSALITIICNLGIQQIIVRERPETFLESQKILLLHPPTASFPSDHGALSMAIAIMALLIWNKKAGFPLLLIALSLGISRIFIGVHYPLDILFGWLMGIFVSSIIYFKRYLFKKIFIHIIRFAALFKL